MPSFPIQRRVFGLQMYFDSRDHPFAWYANREVLEQAENLPEVLAKFNGLFWDVGANAGIYSLWMASRGNQVVSFDISPKAISYILKSAARNNLKNITGVPRAFSTEPFRYQMPRTASAGNRLSVTSEGADATAITYQEAAAQYGIPVIIKMDIEGHEDSFLRSEEFKQWVIKNKISVVMELHRKEYFDLLWKDVDYIRIHDQLVVIQPPAGAKKT
jgi:FkbM family methyltransferase